MYGVFEEEGEVCVAGWVEGADFAFGWLVGGRVSFGDEV